MQRKPLDVSDGAVCASFGLDGSLLSVGASHPVVGVRRAHSGTGLPAERVGADAVRQHPVEVLDPVYGVVRLPAHVPTHCQASSAGECAARTGRRGWKRGLSRPGR
jgi:hypothetical protein